MAFADTGADPALFETGANCIGTFWCASSGTLTDPLSNIKTVEYTFKSTITGLTAGDVEITEPGGAVGDVLRFENNVGGNSLVFIFSNDANPSPADVGLPPSFQSNTATISEGSLYTPTTGKPGFATSGTLIYALVDSDLPEPAGGIFLLAGILAAYLGSKSIRAAKSN